MQGYFDISFATTLNDESCYFARLDSNLESEFDTRFLRFYGFQCFRQFTRNHLDRICNILEGMFF